MAMLKNFFLVFSLSFAAVTVAHAAKSDSSGIATGYYLGAQLGHSSVGAVTGYQFTRKFGMEAYVDYFDPIYTRAISTTIAEKYRGGASALAMFPMSFDDIGPMAIFVKFGYALTIDKLTTSDPGLPPSIPASKFVTTTQNRWVTGAAGVHVDMSTSASVRMGMYLVGAEHTAFLVALYRF